MTTATGTTSTRHIQTRRLPRTTGALSGLLVIVLGIWGGLIPFVGPYFHYAFGSYKTWHYTSERLWLCIVPGAVAVIGGLLLLRSSRRSSGLLGGWLGIAAGAWFAIGPAVSLLWHSAGNPIGAPMGNHTRQAIEWLGYFSGLGVVIAALSAFAMGRYISRPRVVEEAAITGDEAVAEHEERVAERDAPVGATAAGGAVAAHEARGFGARDETAATREEPVAARGEPVAARDEPVAAREEPVAAREETAGTRDEPAAAGQREEPMPSADESARRIISPGAPANEPVAPATEPAAPATEPAAPAGEPGASGDGAATGPATTTGPASVTYRRRPGLSRLRRR
ncbi:MAG TPA: hypothetical protein VHZ27_14100 [Solirubrobacteraceae bacterium]|jgi:hypothetical protein|nr:hypothetical protein [Solirubrobacteraceae bacterium]